MLVDVPSGVEAALGTVFLFLRPLLVSRLSNLASCIVSGVGRFNTAEVKRMGPCKLCVPPPLIEYSSMYVFVSVSVPEVMLYVHKFRRYLYV